MAEVGIDVSRGVPKRLTPEDANGVKLLITLGCGESCPVIPGLATEDWTVADPVIGHGFDPRRVSKSPRAPPV